MLPLRQAEPAITYQLSYFASFPTFFFFFLGYVRLLPLLEGASGGSTKVITVSDTEPEYLLKSNQQSRNM